MLVGHICLCLLELTSAPEFDEVDFCVTEDDHPDEITLANSVQTSSNEKTPNQPAANAPSMQPPSRPLARSVSAGSTYNRQPQTPNQPTPRGQFSGGQNQPGHGGSRPQQQQFQQNRPQPHQNGNYTSHGPNQNGHPHQTPPKPPGPSVPGAGGGEVVGFFSARAVSQLPEESLNSGQVVPQAGQIFNPRAESPSIRKTPGIDHTKSKPVARNGQHVAPSSSQSGGSTAAGPATGAAPAPGPGAGMMGRASGPAPPQPAAAAGRGNVINPQLDHARRIGAPGGGPGSPLANRGQYRPPTIIHKRQLPGEGAGPGGGPGARAPLADVSNNNKNNPGQAAGAGAMGPGGPDAKRQKMA